MGWWLLQCFQQSVERLFGEHVDLVDDVRLARTLIRQRMHCLFKLTNIIDTAVTGGVDLVEVYWRDTDLFGKDTVVDFPLVPVTPRMLSVLFFTIFIKKIWSNLP